MVVAAPDPSRATWTAPAKVSFEAEREGWGTVPWPVVAATRKTDLMGPSLSFGTSITVASPAVTVAEGDRPFVVCLPVYMKLVVRTWGWWGRA